MSRPSDFRSDTVTRPPREMLEAMVHADVGDAVLGDDPTVRRLEEEAAARLGKEAAIFLVSGTMANQAAVAAWTSPGDEVILEAESHCIHFEAGGLARNSGAQIRPLPGRRGALDPSAVKGAIRDGSSLAPRTGLVLLEQTHMNAGGAVLPVEGLREVQAVARAASLPVHMDGARLFNAAVASGLAPSVHAACADSVSFSLVKGLCCPAGSLLCGPASFVVRVRRVWRALGGGWRQAGYLAACGLWALDRLVDRLGEDHALARRLAEGLAAIRGVDVDVGGVETNLVFALVDRAEALSEDLAARGVLASAFGDRRLRFVTHRDVGPSDVDAALAAVSAALRRR